MSSIRSYLQLTRSHTAPLEMVPALLGALLATEGQVTSGVLLWGLFGLLYHLAGYGMNSLVDWEKGYDKYDRNKLHHPLNRGDLSPRRSHLLIGGLFMFVVVLGVALAWPNTAAYAAMFLGAVSGVIYNFYGKETDLKFIFISIAHTSVFFVPYVAMGGDIFDIPFILGALYIFLWVVFQISVSGEIKDIKEIKEMNFLRDTLGVYVFKNISGDLEKNYLVFSIKAKLYPMGVKGLNLVIGFLLFLLLTEDLSEGSSPPFFMILVWVLIVIAGVYTLLLIKNGEYNRDKRIRKMAMVELLTLFVFVSSLYGVIGLDAAIMLMVGSSLWVLVFNQIEWGRWIAPDV